ncbi:MAG: peptidylprolyl isomerase [Tannerella sp.]|jgi:peptidylprolyl isomerase/peptidyl-prolyl cis-trans isomerase B (cyclophilin B)|nr:peptidylprolyl isomerase [Tannerella sp.]
MKRSIAALIITLFSLTVCADNEKETKVLIDTDFGKITVRLYNETPQHRDNFIKLVNEHKYDGVLFHRVIKQFMIQAGDPTSVNAPPDKKLGTGDLGYTIPAEIVYPKYFHKAGQLAAARQADETNPEHASSATQFYIVTGKHYTDYDLDKMEQETGKKLTPEEREAYKVEGGAPHLDGAYTVFGEVIKGMKVVRKIELLETDGNDRPRKNVKIKTMKIIK